jgi:hypothetical protein
MARQILLFNDFGVAGPYLGQMLSVLHEMGPELRVIPLQVDAPSGDPRRSAYLLAALVRQGPPDAVWSCVVDPGVGGARRPLMIRAGDRWLVGPDNGLLALAARAVSPLSAWHIDWRPPSLSDSFHGRDLFAPVAASLALGETVEGSPVALAGLVGSGWPDDLPEVIYIDGFGNCMTGIRGGQWDKGRPMHLAGGEISHARTFCEVPAGTPLWYVNSLGLVEIAVNQGRADQCLELAIGDAVRPG